ncbi:PREDICTED: immunoglobulin superfamily member 10-like [Branchiostoma belcheri]|uniref:Immunoglobulin superfamily member 10-like n=1 Tax=Branchiostoma belcheri TaxID=7741 RepID=A0A6P4Z949_BRABE|nr:PREDICTED: immunoglobulin superfamily member 10-like [Branchiostoma belcheri]
MATLMTFKRAILVLCLTWEVTGQNVTCPNNFRCPKGSLSCLSYHSRDNIYSIPSPLAPSLARISIRHQNITNIKVGDFPLLKSLGSMRIQDSRVASIQSESFATLPCLMELDLTGNNIRKLEPDTFKALHNLRIMQLSRNRIHSVDQAAFAVLPKLKTLGLNNNCLFSIPRSIALLKSLRHLSFLNNIKTFPIRVEELSSLPVSDLGMNKIGCDCGERAAKRWLLGSPHTLMWRVVCIDKFTGQMMWLKDIPWSDLTCPAPKVSVTLENRGENGIEAICQTYCEKGLAFSWILPNGEHSSSSYEYSTNSTHIRTVTCKGSDVDISETKRMCSSVLNILDKTIAGNYTCIVTTNYTNSAIASVVLTISNATDNVVRNTTPTDEYVIFLHEEDNNSNGLPRSEVIIYTGVGTFFCCCVVFVICMIKRRPVSEGNDGQGVTVETHYENDDQFPETNPDRHYENDDRFPETNGGTHPDGHYENDDQFTDANPDAVKHYENTDQNREERSDRQYENEMKANAAFQTCEVYGDT